MRDEKIEAIEAIEAIEEIKEIKEVADAIRAETDKTTTIITCQSTSALTLSELAYLYGKPTVTGGYKQHAEDFLVKEDLGFALTGDGEHVLVYLQKCDYNTLFVAEQLAKYVGLSPKLVSYAGLKDRKAVTQQWFSLHMPGKETPDFSDFNLAGCQILTVTRHNKKLKIGALKGNAFTLVLREISDRKSVDEKLAIIKQNGVPNYFGEQRFGHENNNITQAIKWANGEITVKDRKKRSFYLSAARSAIFNHIVNERIQGGLYKTVLEGDILQLADRGSWFVAEISQLTGLQQRLQQGEINLTAPLLGDSPLATQNSALEFEQACLKNASMFNDLFKKEHLDTVRRAICLHVKSLEWQWLNENTVEIHFDLPSGCYATSVLRELIVDTNNRE